MNCDCIKDIEGAMAAYMKTQAGEDATAKIQNTALGITGDMSQMYLALQIPFRVKGSKKGFTSEKGKEIGCSASYCPFCGREARPGRYTVGQDAGIEAAMSLGEGKPL